MEQGKARKEAAILFERLVSTLEKLKKTKREDDRSNLLFELYGMNRNNISKVFSESATWVDPETVDLLLQQGIIQRIAAEDGQKYALTLKGIALCIQTEYGVTLEEQFTRFLELSDAKFTATDQTQLNWKEKLASLSLILLSSTSADSAILLTNESNKAVLTEVFTKTLASLKKFGVVEESAELKTVDRGESPVSALMSRLDTLTRKTNHYFQYVGKGSGYFFDIEKEAGPDEKRLVFLLQRIFEQCDFQRNYREMYKELAEISQLYSPRFLGRTTNPKISISILRKLDEFMDKEIWRLPPQSKVEKNKFKTTNPKGSFWPTVRERMEKKATELYLKDHPEVKAQPSLRELRENGYLETAKSTVLKEMYLEKKSKVATPETLTQG